MRKNLEKLAKKEALADFAAEYRSEDLERWREEAQEIIWASKREIRWHFPTAFVIVICKTKDGKSEPVIRYVTNRGTTSNPRYAKKFETYEEAENYQKTLVAENVVTEVA